MAAEVLKEGTAVAEEETKMLSLVEGNYLFANCLGTWEKVGALNVVEEAIESASVVIGLEVLVPQEVEEAEEDLMDQADHTAQIEKEEVTAREDLTAPEESTPTEAQLQEAEAAEEEAQAKTADVEVAAETLEM